MTELSKWGRWGKDDQLGALNLITIEKRRQAMALALFAYNPQPGAPATGANGGFDLSVVPWLKARGVAVTSGVRPIPEDRHADHRLVLVALGVYLLDGVELRPLAETAARLDRWEFMLVVAPLRVPGSTGSPVNPLAMF